MDDVRDLPADLDEELEEFEDDVADMDEEIRSLVDALRARTDRSLRTAIRYSGDDWTLLYVREDLTERYSEPELEERIESLVVKGLGDPPREESLYDFGRLDAVFRWYDAVLVATFPVREWSGLVFTFDREASPIVDLAMEHLSED